MKRVRGMILCEGETDRVLISAYLGKVCGWKYFKYKAPPINDDAVAWYKNDCDEVLGIWIAGGNRFSEPIKRILELEKLEPTFEAVAVVTDHDDLSAEQDRLEEVFCAIDTVLGNHDGTSVASPNQWCNLNVTSDFASASGNGVRIAYLLVPLDEVGALESFMLDALSEKAPEKKYVVAQSRSFVKSFESGVYLRTRRERTKAELGVALAVFSPDKVFTTMRELIESVDWSSFETAGRQFELLTDI